MVPRGTQEYLRKSNAPVSTQEDVRVPEVPKRLIEQWHCESWDGSRVAERPRFLKIALRVPGSTGRELGSVASTWKNQGDGSTPAFWRGEHSSILESASEPWDFLRSPITPKTEFLKEAGEPPYSWQDPRSPEYLRTPKGYVRTTESAWVHSFLAL